MKKFESLNGRENSRKGKGRLHKAIQLALASSVLVTGIAAAALQDRGPSDALLTWPLWYRDNDNLALGLCKSQVISLHPEAANAEMCFPIEPNNAGFNGNVGDEIFYMNLNAFIENGGISLRYVTALEAAYGGATGAPPAAAGPLDQIVFARVRFVMSVNDEACAGPYRIVHPWGDEFFPDVQPGPRSLFETVDKPLGALLDFEGALNGDVGPFLHWDGGLNGVNVGADEVPLPRTAANFLKYGAEEFIGDPNVPHTYTGSPKIEFKRSLPGAPLIAVTDDPNAIQNPALGVAYTINGIDPAHQNYIKVIAPQGCDIGGTPVNLGGEGINVQKEPLGNLLGQVWTANIPTPTKITQAVYSRSTNKPTVVDVWAQTAPGQQLYVTGNGLKVGTKMIPFANNSKHYQAHIELAADEELPTNIDVVNTLSNPVFLASTSLTDVVQVNKAEFDATTNRLCVSASSSDKRQLKLSTAEGVVGTGVLDASDKSGLGCPADQPGDLTASVDFTANGRAPEKAIVTSDIKGRGEKLVLIKDGTPDNTLALLSASSDAATNVDGDPGTPAILDVGSNDGAVIQYGAQAEIVVVTQPTQDVEVALGLFDTRQVGTVVAGPGVGQVTFTSNPGSVGDASFKYFVRVGDDVSNLVTASLKVIFKAGKPTGAADNFAVLRTNNANPANFYKVKVLDNDTASLGTTLDKTSIQIVQQPTKGIAIKNINDGTFSFQPCTLSAPGVCALPLAAPTAGVDTFTYTVKGKGSDGSLSSASDPITVNVVVQQNAEAFTGPNFRSNGGRWDLRYATSWIGNGLTPVGSCYVTGISESAGGAVQALATPLFIAKGLSDATGSFQLATVGNKVLTTANANTFGPSDIPTIPANFRFSIRCGTSNAAPALPATRQAINGVNITAK